jgi:hypothetical protein
MNAPRTTKFSLPKLLLCGLLGFFIFSPGVPSSSTHQKIPAQREQRDAARSVKPRLHFVKFHQPVSQNGVLNEVRGFPPLFHYSNSIKVYLKNRAHVVLLFAPIGINLIGHFLPRSKAYTLFSIQG